MAYLYDVVDAASLWRIVGLTRVAAVTFVCLTLFQSAGAQSCITTLAGVGGYAGYSGDGGAATSALLNGPMSAALDGAGGFLIAGQYNQAIRHVNASGIITTVAGIGSAGYSGDGGAATNAQLGNPYTATLDGAGGYYIADMGNNAIRHVDAAGIISTVAGTGVAGYSGDGGAATNAELHNPFAVALDGAGGYYFSDGTNFVIRRVNASGIISTVAGTAGSSGYSGDGGAATLAQLYYPVSIAVDGIGGYYFADQYNFVIRYVDASGIISTVAGTGGSSGYSGDGGAATLAQLNYPWGVSLDGEGGMFIGDSTNFVVRHVDALGIISTVAGIGGSRGYSGDGGAPTSAHLNNPYGVMHDGAGGFLIGEGGQTGNQVIRYVTPPGMCTLELGTCIRRGSVVMCSFSNVAPYLLLTVSLAGSPCWKVSLPPFTVRTASCAVPATFPAQLVWSTQVGNGVFNVSCNTLGSSDC